MDRSSEFFLTVEVLRQHGGAEASPLVQLAGKTRISPPSALHKASTELATALKRTARRVFKLHKLAHRRGLFDDPAAEINELTVVIKSEIGALDAQMGRFAAEAARASAGVAAADPSRPAGHWPMVSDMLRNHLLSVTRTFQDALRVRSERMREQANRRQQLAASAWMPPPAAASALNSPLFAPMPAAPPPAPAAAPAAASIAPSGAVQPAAELRRRGGGPPTQSNSGSSSSSSAAVAAARQEEEAAAAAASYAPRYPVGLGAPAGGSYGAFSSQQLARAHDAQSRAADMRAVESTIVELGGMFTRMATLVAEQGDTLARIDADMDDTLAHVSEAQGELAKYYASVRANRGFILRLFGVIIFVIILFAVFR